MPNTPTRTGFKVRCLRCGTTNGTRRLNLDFLHCSECDEMFSLDELRAEIAEAERLLDRIDRAAE